MDCNADDHRMASDHGDREQMVDKEDVALVRKELEANATNVRSPGEQAFNRMWQTIVSNEAELRRLRKLKGAVDTIGKAFRGWDY